MATRYVAVRGYIHQRSKKPQLASISFYVLIWQNLKLKAQLALQVLILPENTPEILESKCSRWNYVIDLECGILLFAYNYIYERVISLHWKRGNIFLMLQMLLEDEHVLVYCGAWFVKPPLGGLNLMERKMYQKATTHLALCTLVGG